MANTWYPSTTYPFTEFTRAIGSQVLFEFTAIKSGFDALEVDLPDMVGDGTGFTQTVVLLDATLDTHAVTLAQLKTWPAAVDADSNPLTGLPNAVVSSGAVPYGQMTSYVNSVVTMGGDPAEVAITDLDDGAATADQYIRINAAGDAVVGYTQTWEPAETAAFTLVAWEKYPVDISGGSVTADLPATLVVGQEFTLSAYGSDSNTLTLNRNGHTILDPKGVNVDSVGDGNLTLENGNTATLIAVSTSSVRIV